jgi:hypothetical protein
MNSAATYSEANLDDAAVTVGSLSDHIPAPIELARNCGRSGTDDCESRRQSEGAHTIVNHGSPHTFAVLLVNSNVPVRPVDILLGSRERRTRQ